MPSALHDRAGLTPSELEALARELAPLTMLDQVIAWAGRQEPRASVLEVVVQDEFTHDVVIAFRRALFLAFGTT